MIILTVPIGWQTHLCTQIFTLLIQPPHLPVFSTSLIQPLLNPASVYVTLQNIDDFFCNVTVLKAIERLVGTD